MRKKYIVDSDKEEVAKSVSKLFSSLQFPSDGIPISEWIDMLTDYIESNKRTTEKARKELAEFKKDEEIQYWKNLYEEERSANRHGFAITDEEYEAVAEWQRKHDADVHCLYKAHERAHAGGAIGGRYFYKFVPTSIGVVGTCVCGSCHRIATSDAEGDIDKYGDILKRLGGSFTFQEL